MFNDQNASYPSSSSFCSIDPLNEHFNYSYCMFTSQYYEAHSSNTSDFSDSLYYWIDITLQYSMLCWLAYTIGTLVHSYQKDNASAIGNINDDIQVLHNFDMKNQQKIVRLRRRINKMQKRIALLENNFTVSPKK